MDAWQHGGRPRRSLTAGPVAELAAGRRELVELVAIFPQGVPITSPLPTQAELAPEKLKAQRGKALVYFLDVERCTEAQLEALAQYVIGVCGGGTAADVLASLVGGVPMPLRAHLVASVTVPLKLTL